MSFSSTSGVEQRYEQSKFCRAGNFLLIGDSLKIAPVFRKHLRPKPDTPNLILELPPELRNYIYELVVYSPPSLKDGTYAWIPQEPNLLRTCKQIRSEATSILLADRDWNLHVSLKSNDIKSFVRKTHGLVAMQGPKPFKSFHFFVFSYVWPHLQNLLPLLQLMRGTGFEPANEDYVPQPVSDYGKRFETNSSIFQMFYSSYTDSEKGNVQLVLESALIMARKARAEGWSADKLATSFEGFVKEQVKSKGKRGKMLNQMGLLKK